MRVLIFVLFLLTPTLAWSGEAEAIAALGAAIEEAETHKDKRFAFSLEHWSSEGGDDVNLHVRYDPRRDDGEAWHLADNADEAALDKPHRKALKELRKSDADDGMLVYDGLSEFLAAAQLREETDRQYILQSKITDEETPAKVRDALEIILVLEKASGHVSSITIAAKDEFKPAPVAKVTKMRQRSEFVAPQNGLPALLSVNESMAEGKAMLKKFNSRSRQTIHTVELIDADELPASQ